MAAIVTPFQSHQDQVARQLVLGVLDSQLAETAVEDAMPEVQFAYDGDVFRRLAQQEQDVSMAEVSWECVTNCIQKDYLALKVWASRCCTFFWSFVRSHNFLKSYMTKLVCENSHITLF